MGGGRIHLFSTQISLASASVLVAVLLFFTLSPERMNGFRSNLYRYITGWEESIDDILVTLTSFSRSQEFKDLKNGLSAQHLVKIWMDLTKLK